MKGTLTVDEALGLTPRQLESMREAIPRLHHWYRANARDLPWRRTRDPYAIWISEAMLQQTQVATVIPYYSSWMKTFPDIQALAWAERNHVLQSWEGLGYYSRAVHLHQAAQEIMENLDGKIPDQPDTLRALPGVGPYTAAAVLSIAFDLDLPVIDGNVIRVLSRLSALSQDPHRAPWKAALEDLAGLLLPPGTAALHNQAMMEFGALVCTPRAPDCSRCPMKSFCLATISPHPEDFPPKRPHRRIPHHQVAIGIVVRRKKIFINQRPYGALLGGLWEFPGGKIEENESAEQALVRELREEFGMTVRTGRPLPPVKHAYSHFKVTDIPPLPLRLRTHGAARR